VSAGRSCALALVLVIVSGAIVGALLYALVSIVWAIL